MKKLYILDGSGFLFRAYHAFPPLTHSDGYNINVVYGFIRMLCKILLDKPDYLVIARDSHVKTIRHEMYAEYKANRPEPDQDLKRQIPYTQEVVAQLNIPALQIPGYEADDIIATLARTYQKDPNLHISILSSDKDLKQLITTNISCIDAMKGIETTHKSFLQEFGFEPEYMLDYLSLIGDASDNIPGVPGIGPKRAQHLVSKYHTIDNIFEHLSDLSDDMRTKLQDHYQTAQNSRSLVKLQDITPLQNELITAYSLDIDFTVYNRVLLQNHNFTSMNKILQELKNVRTLPQQQALF
jgi:DNA polymerase I